MTKKPVRRVYVSSNATKNRSDGILLRLLYEATYMQLDHKRDTKKPVAQVLLHLPRSSVPY